MVDLSILENHGTCDILLYMLEKGEVIKYDLRKNLQLSGTTVDRDLLDLFQTKLIKNVPSVKGKKFALTESGKFIAGHLLEIKTQIISIDILDIDESVKAVQPSAAGVTLSLEQLENHSDEYIKVLGENAYNKILEKYRSK